MVKREELPTVEDVSTALQELGVDEVIIAEAVQKATERRREERIRAKWEQATYGLASAYKRTLPGANDTNIEGWFERMDYNARTILEQAPSLSEKTPLQQLAVEAAARIYLYDIVETSEIYNYDEDQLTGLFERSGVNPDALRREFLDKFIHHYTGNDPEEAVANFATFMGMTDQLGGDPEFRIQIVGETDEAFCSALQSSGVELPIIGADGLYEEER